MKSLDLERLWSWLPTFRVVAECQSITEAARLLRLSASSVSRSVRLLETELGRPLFMRESAGLTLNPFGRQFLEALRRSMRIVDDSAAAMRGGNTVFRVAAPRALLAHVLPAIARFRAGQGAPMLFLREGGDARDVAAGITDLLLTVGAAYSETVEARRLGTVELAAFVAPNHPIVRGVEGARAISDHGWIAAPTDFADLRGWPIDRRRSISVEVTDSVAAREACLHGLGPALLPRLLVVQQAAEGSLRELTDLEFSDLSAHAIRRPRLASDSAEILIEQLTTDFRSPQSRFPSLEGSRRSV